MSQALNYSLQKGLFNAKLDNSWDIDSFQFYTGDVGYVFAEVDKKFPANTPVVGECKWNTSLIQYQVQLNEDKVEADIPYTC